MASASGSSGTSDDYFMSVAQVVAARSTCSRKHVGSVIVRDRNILSTGCNESIHGTPGCSEAGHMIERDHCILTLHAELSAVASAARHGVRINGATCYTTLIPCWSCFLQLAGAGIVRICFGEGRTPLAGKKIAGQVRRAVRMSQTAARLGVNFVQVGAPDPRWP